VPGEKITIGNCEVISLTDTKMQFPWGMFFPNVPLPELEAYKDLYPESFGDNAFATDAGAYAVRSGGTTVLVDTGIGPGPIAMLGGITGRLVDDMRDKGVPADSVDIVVHTHLHLDHVGWNVTDGGPTFPNARYYGPRADYDFFSANPQANPQLQQVIPLLEKGRLQLYEGEVPLTDELTTMPTPGHTPGHHSVLLKSGGDALLITGDVAHHPAQVDRTEWSPAFDTDPAKSADTRKQVMERLEAEGHPAAFCHFPAEGFGRIVREGNRRVFQAL
jgi:glyoxylase-like metal-dependent hydrolase (beta-lactamase superfamily II)